MEGSAETVEGIFGALGTFSLLVLVAVGVAGGVARGAGHGAQCIGLHRLGASARSRCRFFWRRWALASSPRAGS